MIEIITWLDSTEFNGWQYLEDVEGFELQEIVTVGNVLQEDDIAVYVSHSVSDGMVLGVLAIPKGCIVNRCEVMEEE